MRLSVRSRIMVAMTIVVAANLVTALVCIAYFARAQGYQATVAKDAARSQATATASIRLTQFWAEAQYYAVGVRSLRPADAADAYGRLVRSDNDARAAIAALAKAAPDASSQLSSEWQTVRLSTFAWLNAELAADDSTVRLWITPSGDLNTNSSSNITAPARLAGLSAADMRPAVRTSFDGLRDGTIRQVQDEALTAAIDATAAEGSARDVARALTIALALVSLLVAVACGSWIYRGTVTPLQEARRFADRVADGDLDAVLLVHRDDEIGSLTAAIQDMKDAVVRELRAMQELAGIVLVTAESVSAAAEKAAVAQASSDSQPSDVADDIERVLSSARTLTDLAGQMIEV